MGPALLLFLYVGSMMGAERADHANSFNCKYQVFLEKRYISFGFTPERAKILAIEQCKTETK